MNGIEKITQRIESDVEREIGEINAQAQAEAEAIRARYGAQADRLKEDILSRGRKAAENRLERMESVAQLEVRKKVLAVKQDLVDQCFRLALERMLALPEKEYGELLAQLAAKAARTGREQVIFSQKDRTRLGKYVVTRANELLGDRGNLTLGQETRPIRGGVILEQDRVETNCSFETLVRFQREAMELEVAGALFDEGN